MSASFGDRERSLTSFFVAAIIGLLYVAWMGLGRGAIGSALIFTVVVCATSLASGDEPDVDPSLCAGAKTSCDGSRTTCCAWWSIDISRDGKVYGAILEDSFDKLNASLEREQQTDEKLCNHFGGDSCTNHYGAPHCADAFAGAAKQVADGMKLDAPIDAVANKAKDTLKELTETTSIFDTYEKIENFKSFAQDPMQGLVDKAVQTVRGGLSETHSTLNGYLGSLNDALGRVRDLRQQQDLCGRYYNPYLDWVAKGDDLWSVGGRFGGHIEAAHRSAAARTGVNSLVRFSPKETAKPVALNLAGPTIVRRADGSGTGRILFGSHGSLDAGQTTGAVTLPLIYAAPTARGVTLSKVDVSQTETPDGTVVIVRASTLDGNEVDELLVCTGGRVIAGDRCSCPGNQFWSNNRCNTPYVPPPPPPPPPPPSANPPNYRPCACDAAIPGTQEYFSFTSANDERGFYACMKGKDPGPGGQLSPELQECARLNNAARISRSAADQIERQCGFCS